MTQKLLKMHKKVLLLKYLLYESNYQLRMYYLKVPIKKMTLHLYLS